MKVSLEQTRGMGSPRNLGKPSWSYHATDFGTEFLGGFTYFKTVLAPGVGEVEVWRNDKMEVLLKKKLTKSAHAQTELVQSKIRALRAKGFQRLIAISQEASGDAYFLEFSKKNLEDHLKICQERDQSVAEEDLLDLFRVLVECGANMEETGDYHPSLTLKNIFRIKEAFKVLNPYVFDCYIDEALRIHLPASMPTKPDGLTKAEKLEINVTQVAVIILSMGLLAPEEQLKKLVKTEAGRFKLLKDLAEKYSPNLSTKTKLILEGKLTSFSELRSLIEVGKFSSLSQNPQGQSSWDISPPIDLERERIVGLGLTGQSAPVAAKAFSSTVHIPKTHGLSGPQLQLRLRDEENMHQLPKPKTVSRTDVTPQKPASSTQQGFKREHTDTRQIFTQTQGIQSMTPPNLAHRSTGALEKMTQSSQEKNDKLERYARTETTLDDAPRGGDRYPTKHAEVLGKSINDRIRKDSLEDDQGRNGLALKEVPMKRGPPAHVERVSLNRNLADELTFSNIYNSEVFPRYSRTPVTSATPTRAVVHPVEEDKAKSAQEFYRPSSKSRDLLPRDLQGNLMSVGNGEDKVSAIFNKLQNRFQRYTSGTLDEDLFLKNKETQDDQKTADRRWTHNPTSLRQNPLTVSSYNAVPQAKSKHSDPSQLLKQELSSVMDRKPNGALRRTVAEEGRLGMEFPLPKHTKVEGAGSLGEASGYMWVNPSFAQPRHPEASKDRGQGIPGQKSQIQSDPDEYRIGQYQSTKLAPRHQLSASKATAEEVPMGMSLRNFRDSRDPDQGSSNKKQQRFEREQEYASLYLTHLKQNEPTLVRPDQDLSVEYSTGKKNRSVSFNLGHASHNSSHLGGVARGRSVVKGILKKGSEEREYWSTRQDVYLHKPQPNLASFKLYTSEDRYTGELASDRGFKIEPTPMKAASTADGRWRPTSSLHEDRIDDKIRKLKHQEFEEHSNYRWRRGLEIDAPAGHSSFGSRMPKTPGYFR